MTCHSDLSLVIYHRWFVTGDFSQMKRVGCVVNDEKQMLKEEWNMDQAQTGGPALRSQLSRRDVMRNGGALGIAFTGLVISGAAQAQGVHGFRNRVKRYQDYKRKNPAPSQSWLDGILPKSVNPLGFGSGVVCA